MRPAPNDYIAAGRPRGMLPDRCSLGEGGRRCPSPPEYVVSIVAGDGEYMVGVACGRHSGEVAARARAAQAGGGAPAGSVRLSPVRPVGTDCIRGSCDDDGAAAAPILPSPAHAAADARRAPR